ncbi:PEP-CTERM sorting domain-containing protein [Geitlerinema sp. P-1104]|uniref:PEP-CTERM sorting domain-containing protein n=1 Tax=Geitlerinema sp. P-1104 TaxID=2546230 RepID=UPI0014776EE8|nr:PEP-CTERM sorting domain-containing protein [Geitlerinema sp. P-1104]NMG59524.1 PEP-CTERM sorting domain-containing protein [Geitlerinema sp. P-1104]
MPFWSAQQQNYQDTGGLVFSPGTSGYIQVTPQDGSSEALNLPFLWWMPYYHRASTFYWWEDYELSDGGPLMTENLSAINFVRFTSYSDPDEFYYLLIPNLDPNPFLSFDSIYLQSENANPTSDIPLLTSLINSDYEVNQITGAKVEFEDILTFELPNTNESVVEVPVETEFPETQQSQDIPEPTSTLSLILIGIIFGGSALKRRRTCRMATQRR